MDLNFRRLKRPKCPKCGKPLKKKDKGKYDCENPSCSVIYVENPSRPDRKVVYSAA